VYVKLIILIASSLSLSSLAVALDATYINDDDIVAYAMLPSIVRVRAPVVPK
jgi:hypothetical protein